MIFRSVMSAALYLLSSQVWAFELSASAPGFENRFARLYYVDDFISDREVKADVERIDDRGNFLLRAVINENRVIRIRIDDKTVSLVVLPEMNLKLTVSYDRDENRGRIFDKELKVKILENSDYGLNEKIWEFQRDYAEFLDKNREKLLAKNILPDVYLFQTKMIGKYSAFENSYFQTYLRYNLWALEDAVLGSERKLYESALLNKQIRYDNLGYMNFFAQFYQQRFIGLSQGKHGFKVLSAINGTQDYPTLMKIVRDHPYIFGDTIAELFIVLGLKEVYGDETFKKPKVLSMLQHIATSGMNPMNRNAAKNVIAELTFLQSGQEAPEFNLSDERGAIRHLSDFSNKTVLLCFWSAGSETCLRQLGILSEYRDKYGKFLEVVGVNTDDDMSKARKILKEREMNWVPLFKDHQYDVVDKYRIKTTPTYVLIDENGKIIKYPARNPEENLEEDLYMLSLKDR